MMSLCWLFTAILLPQFTTSFGGGYPNPQPVQPPTNRPTLQPTAAYCTDVELCSNCGHNELCDTGTYYDYTPCCWGYGVDYGISGFECCKDSCQSNACWTNCPFTGGTLAQQLPPNIQPNAIYCNTKILTATTNGANAADYIAYYSLTTTYPVNIQLDSCDSAFDTELYLFDATGTLLQHNDDSDGCGFNSHQSQLIHADTGSQTYIIKLMGVDDSQYGSYYINVQCTATNTLQPTKFPTSSPTNLPTSTPTNIPSLIPTNVPSNSPTNNPSLIPTNGPTIIPTFSPSMMPSFSPSTIPTNVPSFDPTISPSLIPTISPSLVPTNFPSSAPTNVPSSVPTNMPIDISSLHEAVSWNNYTVPAIFIIVFLIIVLSAISICLLCFYCKKRKADKIVTSNIINVQTDVHGMKKVNSLSHFDSNALNMDDLPIDENGYVYNDESDDEIGLNTKGIAENLNDAHFKVKNRENDEVYLWLNGVQTVGCGEYYDLFMRSGYVTLEMIKGIDGAQVLYDLGVSLSAHVEALHAAILNLKVEYEGNVDVDVNDIQYVYEGGDGTEEEGDDADDDIVNYVNDQLTTMK